MKTKSKYKFVNYLWDTKKAEKLGDDQVSLFLFNIKKSINRLVINAVIIIICLKKMNKSRKWSQANENEIIGKIEYFL